MSIFDGTAVLADTYQFSHFFKRSLASLTSNAFARIDAGGFTLPLQTAPEGPLHSRHLARRRAECIDANPGGIVAFGSYAAIGECELKLPDICNGKGWKIFACRFENGAEDHIAIQLSGSPFDEHCESVLFAIWSVLREDCLREVTSPEAGAAVNALTWVATKKSDAAVIVLNAQGHILETNESGLELLKMGVVLVDYNGILECANPAETKALRQGFQECLSGVSAKDGKKGSDLIMFLEYKGRRMRAPIALSRFDSPDHSEPLIVVLIPCQPDRKRIEMLAEKLGLTPAEARVAALIQLGLSNREAAHIAGIKEQSVNTYAKRVLSKLNVSCRTELVQMLTWQGAIGRES